MFRLTKSNCAVLCHRVNYFPLVSLNSQLFLKVDVSCCERSQVVSSNVVIDYGPKLPSAISYVIVTYIFSSLYFVFLFYFEKLKKKTQLGKV